MAVAWRAVALMRILATAVALSVLAVTPLPGESICIARLVRFISFEAGNDRAAA